MVAYIPRFSPLLIPFLIAYCIPMHSYGFAEGTLVKTPYGYTAIEAIRAGDLVVSYYTGRGQSAEGIVTRVVMRLADSAVRLHSEEVSVVVDSDQQFYVPITHQWIVPRDCGLAGMSQEDLQQPMILYDLVVEPHHTFQVTTHDIIVHNVMEHAVACVPSVTISALSSTLPALSVVAPVIVPVLVGSAVLWMIGKQVMSHMRAAECESDQDYAYPVQSPSAQGYDPEDPEKDKDRKREIATDQIVSITHGKPINTWFATNKCEVTKLLPLLPAEVGANMKRALDKISAGYTDYLIKEFPCGTYLIQMMKPGNVLGSKAVYYKVISCEGRTIAFFKDTFDHMGIFVHRKVKF